MRKALIVAFVANLILTAVSVALLPEQVAIHFGGGGRPDSWAAKEFNALIFLVLEIPLFLMFYYASALPLGVSRKIVNIPHKDYWLSEENFPRFREKLGRHMAEFGVAMFVFLFCISLLTLQANLHDPVALNETLFMVVFVAYMSYTLWWLVRLVRGFQPH